MWRDKDRKLRGPGEANRDPVVFCNNHAAGVGKRGSRSGVRRGIL